jgi:hypothetical protein
MTSLALYHSQSKAGGYKIPLFPDHCFHIYLSLSPNSFMLQFGRAATIFGWVGEGIFLNWQNEDVSCSISDFSLLQLSAFASLSEPLYCRMLKVYIYIYIFARSSHMRCMILIPWRCNSSLFIRKT